MKRFFAVAAHKLQRFANRYLPTMRAHLRLVASVEGHLGLAEAQLLYELAAQVQEDCIVEIGSYRGRSTVALALGAQQGYSAPVYAIEPHEPFTGMLGGTFGPEDRAAFYRTMLHTGCYRNVRLVNLSSEVVTPGWQQSVGLLWIDGDHSYRGVKRDFACWEPFLSNVAYVAFHDSIDARLGPARLINELVNTGRYQTSDQIGTTTVLTKCADENDVQYDFT